MKAKETAQIITMKIDGQEIPQTFIHELKLYINIPSKKIKNNLMGMNSNSLDVKGCPEKIIFQSTKCGAEITCEKCKKEVQDGCYNYCDIVKTTVKIFSDFNEQRDINYFEALFINPRVMNAINKNSEKGHNILHTFDGRNNTYTSAISDIKKKWWQFWK